MPVVQASIERVADEKYRPLWEELAHELARPKPFGQPMIHVQTYPRTGLQGMTVVWDRFDRLTAADRTAVIRQALVQQPAAIESSKVAFAVGMTVPEVADTSLLPVELSPKLTKEISSRDRVSIAKAMLAAGASELVSRNDFPILRFHTDAAAEACRRLLERELKGMGLKWQLIDHFSTSVGLAGSMAD